ncbi:MAG: hypothetical protein ACKVPX_15955 [Myxococcaceae bacterium]
MARTSKRRLGRGQAMVEYSIINWLLIVALVFMANVRIIPGGTVAGGVIQKRNILEMFVEAYRYYYDSYYYALNLPYP